MALRRGAKLTSYLLLVVCLVSGFAWLVARGYGEDEAATIFMAVAFISLVTAGAILRLIQTLPSARADEDWRRRHVVEYYGPEARPERPPPPPAAGPSGPYAPVNDPTREMFQALRGPDLPPPSNWTTVSEEVRYYPTLTGTDMSVEEYNRWTDEFGPLEGQWAEHEERERQRHIRRGEDLEPRW